MSSQDKPQSPLKGFLTYFYGNFIVLILGFIQTPLLTRILATDEYGKTGMFETAVSIIYIFSVMGLDQAYIRYYYAKDIDRRSLLRRCLVPSLSVVTGLSVIYILFSGPANQFLFGAGGRDVVALVVIYTFISVFERFFFLDVRMQQNGVLYSNINIIEKVLSIATIIAAFYMIGNDFRVGLYALAVPWGCTTTFLIIRYLVKNRTASSGAEGESGAYVPSYRELITYGLPFITVLLMEWALQSCDRIALRSLSDFDELGIYTAAMKIVILLITFKNTFIAYWSPIAMERFESGDEKENRVFFRGAYDIVTVMCVLAAVFLILFRHLIVYILGPDYRSAENVIPFLTLMPIFAMMFEITNQSIKYARKGKYLNIASVVALAANIAGNLLLVPHLGGLGAAITTGLSYMIYFAIGSYFSEKCIAIGYGYRRTALYSLLLVLYCMEASFVGGMLADVLVGAFILAVVLVIDRKTIGRILVYARNFLKK